MATKINIPVNGRNYTLSHDGHCYIIILPDGKQRVQKYPTKLAAALKIIAIIEHQKANNSNDLIPLEKFVRQYEDIVNQLASIVFPSEGIEKAPVERKSQDEDNPHIEETVTAEKPKRTKKVNPIEEPEEEPTPEEEEEEYLDGL